MTKIVEMGDVVDLNYSILEIDGVKIPSPQNQESLNALQIDTTQSTLEDLSNLILKEALGLKIGQKKQIFITKDTVITEFQEELVVEIPLSQVESSDIDVGHVLHNDEENLEGVIVEIKNDVATVDFNHPLAGRNFTLEIEILNIK